MKNLWAVSVLILVAAPLAAETASTRLRVENSGVNGRVEVVLSEEQVRTVEVNIPGVVSGETITVSAPAPQVRLSGGTIQGDPLLEAMVDQKVRASAPRKARVVVLPSPEPYRAGRSRYSAYHGFVDADYLAVPWYPSYTYTGRRPVRPMQTKSERRSAPSPSFRSGGSASGRGMLPKR